MFEYIEERLRDKDIKRIFGNFISLSVLQSANYLLPLITLPYLARVLGPERFGLIMFAQAFAQYFVIFADYGFSLSAVREVSILRNEKEKLSDTFSSIVSIKMLLSLLGFLMFSAIIFSLPRFRSEWDVYLLSYGVVIGNVLTPLWFFQGIEMMRTFTLVNTLSKIAVTVAMFLFIRRHSDYLYFPLFNSLGLIISGITAMAILLKTSMVRVVIPSFRSIKMHLQKGWHVFISSIASSAYIISNTFILGIFTNNETVGYYSASEKLVRALTQLFNPLYQTLYPYVSKKAESSTDKVVYYLRKLICSVAIVCSILVIPMFIFSGDIIRLVLGGKFEGSILIYQVFLPLIVVIPIAYIVFNIAMLSFKLDRYYSRIYITGAFSNVILILLLLKVFHPGGAGVAAANLMNEILITIIALAVLKRNGIQLLF